MTESAPLVMIDVMDDSGDRAALRGPEMVSGLYWAVRESFVGYVAGTPDGQVFGDDGAETDGQGTFRFPLVATEHHGARWRIRFEGTVRFLAHGGMLNVTLASPVLDLDAEKGSLYVAVGDREVAILDVTPAAPVEVDGGWRVFPPLAAQLTPAGSALFGDVYAAGEPFAPLQVALPADAGTA